MIILSQNGNILMNFDNLTQVYITQDEKEAEYHVRCETVDSLYETLGMYKSEERAKEVLQEITFAYANMEMLKIPKIDIHQLIPATEMVRNLCYKMPEE